jgi:hypothetical protein
MRIHTSDKFIAWSTLISGLTVKISEAETSTGAASTVTGPTGPQGNFAYSTLPTSAVTGDAWFDPETGKAFIYYDNYWVEVGAAPAGPTGPQGIQGNLGPTGPQGLQGPTGPAGTGTAGSADLATTWWLGY